MLIQRRCMSVVHRTVGIASKFESRTFEDSQRESPAEAEPSSEPAEPSADPDKVRGSRFNGQLGLVASFLCVGARSKSLHPRRPLGKMMLHLVSLGP